MSVNTKINTGKILKLALAFVAIVAVAHYGFAVDGTQGGTKSTKVYSTIKTNLNFSLKTLYSTSNPKYRQMKRVPSMSGNYSLVYFQKGNQTWVTPQRGGSKLLQKFKTPSL
jgi:hypothetical protein